MSNWETPGTPEEISLEAHDILRLGIQPELLATLEPGQAKTVISGIAKVLAKQIHPDIAEEGAEIFGLTTADITSIEARSGALDDDALEAILSGYGRDSIVRMVRDEKLEAQQTAETLLQANDALARAMIFGPERVQEQLNASVLIYNIGLAGDPSKLGDQFYRNLQQEAFVLSFVNGRIEVATVTSVKKGLVSSLNTMARDYLNSLRPDISGPDIAIYISDDNEYELDPGWYCLQTATSKTDRTKRVPAYRFYNEYDEDNTSVDYLVGARVVGRFCDNNQSPNHISGALEVDDLDQKATIRRANGNIMQNVITRISEDELTYMLARGIIKPFQSVEELNDSKLKLVLHKENPSGSNSVNVILSDTNACHLR